MSIEIYKLVLRTERETSLFLTRQFGGEKFFLIKKDRFLGLFFNFSYIQYVQVGYCSLGFKTLSPLSTYWFYNLPIRKYRTSCTFIIYLSGFQSQAPFHVLMATVIYNLSSIGILQLLVSVQTLSPINWHSNNFLLLDSSINIKNVNFNTFFKKEDYSSSILFSCGFL